MTWLAPRGARGSDERLERLLECTMMIMEALDGFESKFEYALVGHSGDR